jgi:hypothetical protein
MMGNAESPRMIEDEMDEYDEEINVDGDHSNVIINDH